jgi:tetratricopeptide (TPR) repeat protein
MAVAATTLGILVSPALSQEKGGTAADAGSAQALIKKAYAKTETAKSLDDYAEVIRICEQAQASKLSEARADYVKRLLSWAQNRRGEAYADQAIALDKKNQAAEAAKMDALALADFQAAVKNDPTRWRAIHNRGVSQALAGEYDEAMSDFDRTIKLKPDYANAWFNRGEIRYEQGKYAEAVADYSQSLRLKDEDAGVLTSRGHAYFQLRQFRKALADYDQALRAGGETGDAYANRADAHHSLGQWEEAAKDYRQAIKLDPKLGRAFQGAAWLMATCPVERIRNADLAIEAAQRAIALGDEGHECLDTLAAAYANAGQFDQAKTTLAKAMKAASEADAKRMQPRLALYEAKTPYRQTERAAALSPSATKSRKR